MVPNGWVKTDLNTFIDIKHGFAFKSEYFKEEGEYVLLTPGSFYEPGGFRDQKSKTKYYAGDIPKGYLLSKGELLVAMTEQAAGLLGSTLFVPSHDRYLHNQRLGLIQIKDKNGICPEFLYLTYNAPYVRKQIAEQSTGTKVKHTSPDKLKSVVCLLPPLPEQQKLAKIHSTWDKAITTTEKLIATSKQQKKALMQQLLTGKKRLLNPETGKAFEGDWEEVKLDDLAVYRRGSFPQPYGNPEWFDEVNGYPFIQVFDIAKNMKLKIKTKTKISYAAIDKSVFVEKGTVIVSLQGSIGRVAVTQYDAYVDRTVLLFQTYKREMNKIFFAFAIQKLFEIEKEKAPGGTIKTITKQVLSHFTIMVPKFIEQQKIASVLTASDKEIELLQAKLAHLKQEKKALMQQLLTGKHRVKVDLMEAV